MENTNEAAMLATCYLLFSLGRRRSDDLSVSIDWKIAEYHAEFSSDMNDILD